MLLLKSRMSIIMLIFAPGMRPLLRIPFKHVTAPRRSNQRLRGMLEQEAGVASWGTGLSSNPDDGTSGDALKGAPLWELSLTAVHFHPHVAQAAASISALPPDSELFPLS